MASSAIGTPTFLAKVQNLTDGDGTSFSQFIPAGVVLPFAGTTAPAGFLLCNGATVSRSTYSKLFAAIGSAHGSGDGSTTFHLPDYRGRFLRGTDGGATRDPNAGTRTAANSGGATGDNVGSVQGNATAKNGLGNAASSISALSLNNTDLTHNHGFTARNPSGTGNVTDVQRGWDSQGTVSITTGNPSVNANHAHTLSSGTAAAQTITGDSETRPVNANVNYIIKI